MDKTIDDLLNETRVFYNALVNIGETLHAEEPLSLGMRAILELLSREGPQTVPDMARARRVTRQRVQTLVDGLKDRGFATARPNPEHKRSVMIDLTPSGTAVIERMKAREREYITAHLDQTSGTALSDRNLRTTLRVLRTLREQLERSL